MRIAVNGLAAKSEGALTYLVNILPEFVSLSDDSEFVVYLNEIGAKVVEARLNDAGAVFHLETVSNVRSAARRIIWEQARLPKLLRDNNVDVLFVPWPSLPARSTCPSVIAIRNMEPYCDHVWSLVTPVERLRYRYLRWSADQALKRARHIILVAGATAPLISNYHHLDEGRCSFIAHGRDPSFKPLVKENAQAAVRDQFGLKAPFILYVSKTRPYKNHVELIEAFALLRGRGHKQHLVIAGELQEPYSGKVKERMVALGLSDRIHFIGDVDYHGLPYLYNACEFFVFPSTCEACPNILIEAMACGLPIAASDIPVMRELGSDAISYFNPFDTHSIAETMERLLTDDRFQSNLREKALKRAEDFSWNKTARRTLQVIKNSAGS